MTDTINCSKCGKKLDGCWCTISMLHSNFGHIKSIDFSLCRKCQNDLELWINEKPDQIISEIPIIPEANIIDNQSRCMSYWTKADIDRLVKGCDKIPMSKKVIVQTMTLDEQKAAILTATAKEPTGAYYQRGPYRWTYFWGIDVDKINELKEV